RRQLAQGPGLLGANHPFAELGPGDRSLDRSGGEDDRLGGQQLIADLDLPAAAGERALAFDQLDLVLLEQPGDSTGQGGDHLLAAGADCRVVHLGRSDLDPELARLADLAQHVGHAQYCLGGDAGVVQTPPTNRVLLDHGRLHPQLRGPDRGHVAARARTDDHAVIGSLCHQIGAYLTWRPRLAAQAPIRRASKSLSGRGSWASGSGPGPGPACRTDNPLPPSPPAARGTRAGCWPRSAAARTAS